MKKAGFTLLELVVVIALLAILAVVILPRIKLQISKAKDARIIAVLGNLRSISEAYYAEENTRAFGEKPPTDENTFKGINNLDKPGLDILIPELSYQGIKLFGGTGEWQGDDYTVDVGGSRKTPEDQLRYGEKIGYTFHAPIGSTADGIMIWFTKYTHTSDNVEYDTKGKKWVEY